RRADRGAAAAITRRWTPPRRPPTGASDDEPAPRLSSPGSCPGGPVTLSPKSFELELARGVATITLNRPDRLNALTFESYRELASTFRSLEHAAEARAVVIS